MTVLTNVGNRSRVRAPGPRHGTPAARHGGCSVAGMTQHAIGIATMVLLLEPAFAYAQLNGNNLRGDFAIP